MSNISVTPQDVKDMGKFCQDKAREIGDLAKAVEARVANVAWKSDAKGRFDKDWGSHKKNLGLLQQALNELGAAAVKMGDNYQKADEAYRSS